MPRTVSHSPLLPQDAAKKALEEMFGGKEDLLAAYDAGGGGNFGKVYARGTKSQSCVNKSGMRRNEVVSLQ